MSYRVEKVGARIHLHSEIRTPGLSREIPGASWSRRQTAWTMPLSYEICLLLRERFGQRLAIGPELTAWARGMKVERASQATLGQQADAELVRVSEVAPKLMKAMDSRTYQRVAARFIARGRRVLIADGVGLGKTYEAMAGIIESGVPGPHLVVCPKTAMDLVWGPEIRRWLPDHEVFTLPEGRAKRDRILDQIVTRPPVHLERTWLAVHPAAVRTRSHWICRECGSETPVTAKPKVLVCGHDPRGTTTRHSHEFPQLFCPAFWGSITADESDQSIIRISGTPNQTRAGMELLRDLAMRDGTDGLRIAMSGTPWRSRPKLLWSTLNWLRPEQYKSFWNWVKLYWALGGFTGFEIGKMLPEREAMLYRSLDGIMLRRTRKEVRADIPDRNYIGTLLNPADESSPYGVWLPMDGPQAKAYAAMAQASAVVLEGGRIDAIGALAELTRLKQFATSTGRVADGEFHPALPSNKYDYILELLRSLGFPDDPQTKVIIVSQFTQTLDLFRTSLEAEFSTGQREFQTLAITGNVSQAARTRAVQDFEQVDSPPHLMFLNVKAGGSAITLDAATEQIFIDETYIPDDQEQAEGRLDNRRPEERVTPRNYRYLRTLGTVEEGIAVVSAQRGLESGALLDGRRGLDFARAALKLGPGQ